MCTSLAPVPVTNLLSHKTPDILLCALHMVGAGEWILYIHMTDTAQTVNMHTQEKEKKRNASLTHINPSGDPHKCERLRVPPNSPIFNFASSL